MAVVGHLVGAVGPHGRPESVPVNVGPGFRPPSSEDRWPVEGTLPPAGARVAPVSAQRVHGEALPGKETEAVVHRYGKYGHIGPGAADWSGLKLQLRLPPCREAPPWLDQVPDALGTGHRVKQVGPLPFPR